MPFGKQLAPYLSYSSRCDWSPCSYLRSRSHRHPFRFGVSHRWKWTRDPSSVAWYLVWIKVERKKNVYPCLLSTFDVTDLTCAWKTQPKRRELLFTITQLHYKVNYNKYKQIAEQFIVPHLTKGHNSKKRKGRVIVLAHCTPSEHALSTYKVSTKSIHWFWSYAPDKKCGRKDGRKDGRDNKAQTYSPPTGGVGD